MNKNTPSPRTSVVCFYTSKTKGERTPCIFLGYSLEGCINPDHRHLREI
jgi:hypothetical protein